MSHNPYYNGSYYQDNRYDDITGIGRGQDRANGHSYDPNTRSFWPPGEHSRARPSPYSRYGTPARLYAGSTYAGGGMDGEAASFFPGQRSHYYQGMRGEWEDDDF
jgi:hypothetical protein